jgi:hypothetical protein
MGWQCLHILFSLDVLTEAVKRIGSSEDWIEEVEVIATAAAAAVEVQVLLVVVVTAAAVVAGAAAEVVLIFRVQTG